MTVSQSLEYKEWNYVTGDVVTQSTINIDTFVDSTPRAGQEPDSPFKDGQELGSEEKNKLRIEKKNINIVACHVSETDLAFLAVDTNKIIVYSLQTHEVLCIFNSYQGK